MSGTYLAVRSLMEQVKKEETVNILDTVKKLRELRPKLVQTQEQYLFIYQVRIKRL
jgi:protein tyrosine phosphatase